MPQSTQTAAVKRKITQWPFTFLVLFLLPVVLGILIYHLDSFDPVPYPPHELTQGEPMVVAKRNGNMLLGAEKIGKGELLAPEDIAYDAKSGVIYTGCADGWVKRVTLNESAADSVVEKWINTGGRPLGLVLGHHRELVIADAYKGLLNVSAEGGIKLLTDEANGVKFKLPNAVDIGEDGIIYFTDASYKYNLEEVNFDFLEGRPHGRLMSYDPSSKQTKVLLDNLYFSNGIAVSADNQFVIFCETPLRRCRRYHLQGERKGKVDIFVDDLPGLPDNIMYDGEGLYWIAIFTENSKSLQLSQRYPFIRKMVAIIVKYIGKPHLEKNGGVIAVDLEGKPIAHYYDENLSMSSSGIKIGNHLYWGSVGFPHITRLDLNRYPAVSID